MKIFFCRFSNVAKQTGKSAAAVQYSIVKPDGSDSGNRCQYWYIINLFLNAVLNETFKAIRYFLQCFESGSALIDPVAMKF
jgi:hypothetical protein